MATALGEFQGGLMTEKSKQTEESTAYFAVHQNALNDSKVFCSARGFVLVKVLCC